MQGQLYVEDDFSSIIINHFCNIEKLDVGGSSNKAITVIVLALAFMMANQEN
mgnify:CR=1 FL=1